MKIRCTIDLNKCERARDDLGSLENGVFGIDEDGVYHMYYHSRTDLAMFENVEVLEK